MFVNGCCGASAGRVVDRPYIYRRRAKDGSARGRGVGRGGRRSHPVEPRRCAAGDRSNEVGRREQFHHNIRKYIIMYVLMSLPTRSLFDVLIIAAI